MSTASRFCQPPGKVKIQKAKGKSKAETAFTDKRKSVVALFRLHFAF
jgi:hypothetical protein